VRTDGPLEADLWLETALGGEALTSVAVSSVSPDGTSRRPMRRRSTPGHPERPTQAASSTPAEAPGTLPATGATVPIAPAAVALLLAL
jgi:hypothetical protein